MRAHQATYPIATMARVFGVSPSGYYAWRDREPSQHQLDDENLMERIERYHRRSGGIYGAPRIHQDLVQEDGLAVSRKRVARLMRLMGLRGVSRRRGFKTTQRDAGLDPNRWTVRLRGHHDVGALKRFDQEDLLAAEWLRCRIGWRHRYRPLRDNERFGGGCGRCHVGDEQRKPFALEGEPDWKSYGLMILNQRWDIVFAKPQVFQEIFKPLGVEGCEVVDTTGDPLNSIVQLKPQELVKLDTSGLRLEECTTCGELKFNHVEGDYLPRVVSETSSDFVATEAVFGSGGQAEHVPMISSRLYRRLLDSGLAGSLDYLPHANEPATDLVR
ncbi:MAG: IS3 family transposase [Myxococcota bacterium]